jgi:2,4-dienoyl-CoA reductase-like NADH-dependent reductase (Old Yellow Enzyme family)/NADPH-dependent 2,4-dienoyl-CoA reductase/sulfur reductase-like enzyme
MAPMGTNYSTTDGISTERDKRYYEERAMGGVAMIMTEAMPVSQGARNHLNSMCLYHDRFIPGLAAVVDAIHKHDVVVVGQISHRGGLLKRSVLGMEPVGPSPWRNPNTGDLVRELRVDEIRHIQGLYVAAARRLMQAGYDGFELHGANGYLFHQFLTPRVNKRTDQYGGTIENRMRLLVETVERIKDELPDFPALVRISATEYVEGGYTTEDTVALARALERVGVIALDLSGGTNESPELSRFCIQPPSMPRKCLLPYARPLKAAVSIPVILAGRIITPEDAESVLATGDVDFVSMGRALYADPHWPLKAFGRIDAPIRECISCNVCFERLTRELDVSCVQNPMVGTEFESIDYASPGLRHARPPVARRVLVLGAGLAGIEAARVAAGLGHIVEVWEKADRPGGQIHLAVMAPDKEEVRPAWTNRWEEIETLGVPVRCGVDADAAAIRAFAPDLVVVATGSKPRPFLDALAGLDPGVARLQARAAIADPTLVPEDAVVTIVGAGMVGIEMADILLARRCRMTVIEIGPTVAPAMARNNRTDIMLRLEAGGVTFRLGTQITGTAGRELLLHADTGDSRIDAGAVVIEAIGPQSDRGVVPMVEAAGAPYVLVGDCSEPGDFLTAIRDGFMAAWSLQTRFGRTTNGSH